jgi:DNA-binding transcriptional ArsR family regulator
VATVRRRTSASRAVRSAYRAENADDSRARDGPQPVDATRGGGRRQILAHALDSTPSVSQYLPFVGTYQAGDGWGALGDRTRRTILARLAERPRAVGELADELPVSRPAVSQHLKVLKNAGLVTEHAAGTRRIYRLNPAGVAALRDQLDTFWTRALASYKDIVEQPTEERS